MESRSTALWASALAVALLWAIFADARAPRPETTMAQAPAGTAPCELGRGLSRIGELQEASGVAAVSGAANRVWVVKDSHDPAVYSVDLSGRVIDRVPVSGANVFDWEDLAPGPCPGGRC